MGRRGSGLGNGFEEKEGDSGWTDKHVNLGNDSVLSLCQG